MARPTMSIDLQAVRRARHLLSLSRHIAPMPPTRRFRCPPHDNTPNGKTVAAVAAVRAIVLERGESMKTFGVSPCHRQ
jgi:hypothetical protein